MGVIRLYFSSPVSKSATTVPSLLQTRQFLSAHSSDGAILPQAMIDRGTDLHRTEEY
jgi:hypothetical protein